MTVKECYEAIGADYEEVLRRLANEERVARFLLKFPGDESFAGLVKAVEESDGGCVNDINVQPSSICKQGYSETGKNDMQKTYIST